MRIAVVGAGISGLAAAHLLSRAHEVTVFEANDYPGGHTHTHDVRIGEKIWAVDSGFIVFNERTYPNFIKLLNRLGVASQPTEMSFSVVDRRSGLQYRSTNLNTLFAQRRNLFRPSFWRLLADILRFRREFPRWYGSEDLSVSLGELVRTGGYSRSFVDQFLVPMGSAIWSADPARFLDFPAAAFVTFFHNHGILDLRDQPRWLVIAGGSREYVKPLCAPFRNRLRLSSPVVRVRRHPDRVEILPRGGEAERYDQLVLACHSDQALALLADATPAEREILGAIPYQKNEAVLHTDRAWLPSRRRAWASWNCLIPEKTLAAPCLTYYMNRLQSLEAPQPFCVTLNPPVAIAEERVLRRMVYHHPVYSEAAFRAHRRWEEINGTNRTWFCGAYWGYGFHEDGLNSALAVCKKFGQELA